MLVIRLARHGESINRNTESPCLTLGEVREGIL